MIAALAAAFLAVAQGAEPVSLKEADSLYFHRHQGNNLDASNGWLRDALRRTPSDEALLWRLGRGLVASAAKLEKKDDKLSVLKEAETVLKQAVSSSPEDAQAHYWLAREMGGANELLQTLGLARSMKKELETALKLDPKNGAAHQTYGELLRQLPRLFGGNKEKAVLELEESLRLTPNDTGHHQAMAEAYLKVDRKQDAVNVLKKVFDVKEPEDPGAWDSDLNDARELLKRLSP